MVPTRQFSNVNRRPLNFEVFGYFFMRERQRDGKREIDRFCHIVVTP